MEKKLEKGSDEWQFFQDFWKFRQQYYEPDNADDWMLSCMEVGDRLIRKYENTGFAEFAKDMIFSHFNDVERRWKLKHE